MRWDWYSATVPESVDVVLAGLFPAGELVDLVDAPGMYSFDRSVLAKRGDRVLCRAFWGGQNGDSSTHLQGSGSGTSWLVDRVRAQWPDHRVSRADVCEDYSGARCWRRLSKLGIRVADECGVKTRTAGDWLRGKDGRTLYVGGRTSYVQGRIYEKGKQLGENPDWVRVELQARPSGEGKAALATVEPVSLFGAARWTRELGSGLGMADVEALKLRDAWEPSTLERALRFCVRQYGACFESKAQELGSWEALGAFLGERVLLSQSPGATSNSAEDSTQ
jgi:hypothetical protein